MNGYSKIGFVRSSKSRSMDLSDLLASFPRTPKPISSTTPKPTSTHQESKQSNANISTKDLSTHEYAASEQEDEVGLNNGERFGVILSRNCSVSSSTSSHRSRFETQSAALPSTVKRAFSMRRSSSVSERYCRIHDQCASLASPIDDEAMETMHARSVKKKHRGGKIIKACKRFLGL